jgi:hypothetical protein
MFSSRQSECSGLWKYVNVLVVSRWQLFACLTLQSYDGFTPSELEKSNPLLFNKFLQRENGG